MLHDISDRYPIHLTLSKTRLKIISNKDFLVTHVMLTLLLLTENCTKILLRYR